MTPTKSAYLLGVRQGAPFVFVLLPFSMMFGVVATEAGLNILEVISFSVIILAGAAQFTAVQLMTENAPTIIVIVSALAVNLRMAMYSASLAPHLGPAPLWQRATVAYLLVDQTFALSVSEYERKRNWSIKEKLAFFFGTATPVMPCWMAGTVIGAMLGSTIPPEYALDFALPILFLAMVAPALRTLAHVGAAGTALVLSPMLTWVPHSLGTLCAGLAAMAVGAEIERRMNKRQA